jgi:hypothetical protein
MKGGAPIQLNQGRRLVGIGGWVAERGNGVLQLLGTLLVSVGSHRNPPLAMIGHRSSLSRTNEPRAYTGRMLGA